MASNSKQKDGSVRSPQVRLRSTRNRIRANRWIGAVSLAVPLLVVGVNLFGSSSSPSEADRALASQQEQGSGVSSIPATSVEVLGKSVLRSSSAPSLTERQTHRVTGYLPDSASLGASVSQEAVSKEERDEGPPSSVAPELPEPAGLPALPAWRLASPVSYASGAIKAKPLPRSVRPIRLRSAVTSTATKVAANQFGGSLRPADVDVFFAEYDAPVGEWLGKVESIETEPRSVWFVVFTGMESKRSTGVVRARDLAAASTTLSLDVTSDVVVVIDDDTGEVLVASEFLSENGGRYTRR